MQGGRDAAQLCLVSFVDQLTSRKCNRIRLGLTCMMIMIAYSDCQYIQMRWRLLSTTSKNSLATARSPRTHMIIQSRAKARQIIAMRKMMLAAPWDIHSWPAPLPMQLAPDGYAVQSTATAIRVTALLQSW